MISISELSNMHNYLSKDVLYLFDKKVWEYDIKQANINALRSMNRISQEQYQYLSTAPKMEREIVVGNMIRKDSSIQDSIYEGIRLAKINFLDKNTIQAHEVLRIANDSIYVISPVEKYNKVININGYNMTFVLKNVYTSYMNLNNVLFFYKNEYDNWDIDIKGINKDRLVLVEPFITFLCNLMQIYDNAGQVTALDYFNKFYNDYINKNLSASYYREFNSFTSYRFKTPYGQFMIQNMNENDKDKIDINYNLMILRSIYSYLMAG